MSVAFLKSFLSLLHLYYICSSLVPLAQAGVAEPGTVPDLHELHYMAVKRLSRRGPARPKKMAEIRASRAM